MTSKLDPREMGKHKYLSLPTSVSLTPWEFNDQHTDGSEPRSTMAWRPRVYLQ